MVKDSWRVVNRRDIIPTIPKLMGYCHVPSPVYLNAGVPGGGQVREAFTKNVDFMVGVCGWGGWMWTELDRSWI